MKPVQELTIRLGHHSQTCVVTQTILWNICQNDTGRMHRNFGSEDQETKVMPDWCPFNGVVHCVSRIPSVSPFQAGENGESEIRIVGKSNVYTVMVPYAGTKLKSQIDIPTKTPPAAPRYQCHARQDESSLKHMFFCLISLLVQKKWHQKKNTVYI